MNNKFKVGKRVYEYLYGWGVVRTLSNGYDPDYPMTVEFTSVGNQFFSLDGKPKTERDWENKKATLSLHKYDMVGLFPEKPKLAFKWINVDDEMPPEYQDVLLLVEYDTSLSRQTEVTLGFYDPTSSLFKPSLSFIAYDSGMEGDVEFRRNGKIIAWQKVCKEM